MDIQSVIVIQKYFFAGWAGSVLLFLALAAREVRMLVAEWKGGRK
jgi:hypothetical protein